MFHKLFNVHHKFCSPVLTFLCLHILLASKHGHNPGLLALCRAIGRKIHVLWGTWLHLGSLVDSGNCLASNPFSFASSSSVCSQLNLSLVSGSVSLGPSNQVLRGIPSCLGVLSLKSANQIHRGSGSWVHMSWGGTMLGPTSWTSYCWHSHLPPERTSFAKAIAESILERCRKSFHWLLPLGNLGVEFSRSCGGRISN